MRLFGIYIEFPQTSKNFLTTKRVCDKINKSLDEVRKKDVNRAEKSRKKS